MAKATRLNVYVTPAGFYDAVVAAPNQAAALKAWGVRGDLFAEKLAGPEGDPHWRDLALASPGEVIRKPRGDAAALLAMPARSEPRAPKRAAVPTPERDPAPPPPDRSALDAAEAALVAAKAARDQVETVWTERRRVLEAKAAAAAEAAARGVDDAQVARAREAAAFERASR